MSAKNRARLGVNTTNVFVELLVIGIGPVAVLILIVLVVLGPGTTDLAQFLEASTSFALLLPMLASTYVLGIVLDRLADRVFEGPARKIRRVYFRSDELYHAARRTVVFHSEAIYRLRQYGRSRLRICRGWATNAWLLVLPTNLYVWSATGGDGRAMALANGILLLTFVSTAMAWRTLAHSEYNKIRGASAFIRRELDLEPLESLVGGGTGASGASDARAREPATENPTE